MGKPAADRGGSIAFEVEDVDAAASPSPQALDLVSQRLHILQAIATARAGFRGYTAREQGGSMKTLEKARTSAVKTLNDERGVVGYGIAWLLGVPVSVLVIIYLIFGR